MGITDTILSMMRLNTDDDDDFDSDYEEEYEEVKQPKKAVKRYDDDYDEEPIREVKQPVKRTTKNKVVPIRNKYGVEVCVIKPTTIEDGKEITTTLVSGRTVILNLEGIHVDLAQRIIDFTSGSCYAIDGNLQKVSSYIVVATPPSVELSGDFQEMLNGDTNLTNV